VRRRVSDEAGFTLIEMLTAMTVGLVVVAAALVLVSHASRLTTTTQNRVDALQRGRAGLEAMVTELRSGVCVSPMPTTAVPDPQPQPPIIYGDGDRVEWYASTGAPNAVPQRRVLRYDEATHTIWRDVFQGVPATGDTNNTKGQTQLPIDTTRVASQSSQQLLTNVYRRDTGLPIFTYRSYTLTQTQSAPNVKYEPAGATVALPTPISAADDQRRVSEVDIAIRVRPSGIGTTANNPLDAILENAAFARSADPWVAAGLPATVTQLPTGEYVGQPIPCT
jgi:prepilin-type N-terminal cleavage/methylation domain-containing protein